MNEIGIAALVVVALMLAFQGVTLLRAKRTRGREISSLGSAAANLLDGRDDALVYFFSTGCAPCRGMTPAVDALMERYPTRLIKVDVSEDPAPAAAFGIRATPTLVRVREGRIDNIWLGAKDRNWIEHLLS